MKPLTYLILAFVTGGCAFAQTEIGGTPWNVTLKVVGEDGQPVAGAKASVGYHVTPPPGQIVEDYRDSSSKIERLTDTNGMFKASHSDDSLSLGFDVQKVGYYATHINYDLFMSGQFDERTVTANRNPSLTVTFKKIGHPIPMYAKKVNLGMPIFNKPAGYDLMVGDWVAPYGKGINTDVIFTGHFDKRTDGESDYTLTVSFPKPGDGIQEFTVPDAEKGSELRSPHEAPADGYQSQWVQTDNRKPGKSVETNRDLNRNYFFRVRTVLDENGNVKSALYGKIYGDFMQFHYYLNPTPNSRNVEFNPKQNLLGGLKSTEQVTVP